MAVKWEQKLVYEGQVETGMTMESPKKKQQLSNVPPLISSWFKQIPPVVIHREGIKSKYESPTHLNPGIVSGHLDWPQIRRMTNDQQDVCIVGCLLKFPDGELRKRPLLE